MACGHRKVSGPTDRIYCQKYRGAVKERLAFRAITAFILNYMGQVPGKRGGLNGSTQHQLEVYLQGAQQLKVCGER